MRLRLFSENSEISQNFQTVIIFSAKRASRATPALVLLIIDSLEASLHRRGKSRYRANDSDQVCFPGSFQDLVGIIRVSGDRGENFDEAKIDPQGRGIPAWDDRRKRESVLLAFTAGFHVPTFQNS